MAGSQRTNIMGHRQLDQIRVVDSPNKKGIEKIEGDTDRDIFLSAEEAQEYGLVDEVLITNQEKKDEE